jgi:hypothetical protein
MKFVTLVFKLSWEDATSTVPAAMMSVFVVKRFHLFEYIQNCIAYSIDNEGSSSTFYLLSVDAVNHVAYVL